MSNCQLPRRGGLEEVANRSKFSDLFGDATEGTVRLHTDSHLRRRDELLLAANRPVYPRPDDDRDHALIASYLDPHTFIMWLRSLLADDFTANSGGDWDAEDSSSGYTFGENRKNGLTEIIPPIEEVPSRVDTGFVCLHANGREGQSLSKRSSATSG